MKIKLPENFRFKTSLEKINKVVDICIKLKEMQLFYLNFDFIKQTSINITEKDYDEIENDLEYNEFMFIINDEICYIVDKILYKVEIDNEDITRFLKEQNPKYTSNQINEIINFMNKKYQIVNKLIDEDIINRFYLKKDTFYKKIINFDYCIEKHQFLDNSECKYANLCLEVSNKIPDNDLPDNICSIIESRNTEKIVFMCDKYDLDVLIKKLSIIKERLE